MNRDRITKCLAGSLCVGLAVCLFSGQGAVLADEIVIDFEGPPTGKINGDEYVDKGVLFGGPRGAQEYNYGGNLTEIITSGDWYAPLEMTFVEPGNAQAPAVTDHVKMQNRWAEDNWVASTYDLDGNLIETKRLNGTGWMEFSTGQIHQVVLDDADNTAFAMDNLTYNEPGGGIPCEDIKKFKAKCRQGKIKVKIVMKHEGHHGKKMTIGIDGELFDVYISRKKTKLKQRGYPVGPHTVTLESPADCEDPIEVYCS